jgi:hypothetical protein
VIGKVVYCTLINRESWAVPIHHIADARAKYYAAKDKDTTYQEEYDYVIEDSYEAIDWFLNEMNPSDLREHFELVDTAPVSGFDEMFRGCECSIVDLKEIAP